MDARRLAADVLIAGAGPAGSAAAIACAEAGLSVILVDRAAHRRDRPTVALHPGTRSVLDQLGVGAQVEAVVGARFSGVWVAWGGPPRFQPLGADDAGPWLGMQVDRRDLDALLLERARSLGVSVHEGCAVSEPVVAAGAIVGAETSLGRVASLAVIDATGAARWLARRLELPQRFHSPALVARYGYVRGACVAREDEPALAGDASGWTWTARVSDGLYQWVRLDFGGRPRGRDWLPDDLAGMTPTGVARGAEVRWRSSDRVAGPGYFIAGDAAAALDPASSHGVLRALLGGVMAARTAAAVLTRGAPPAAAAASYERWLASWLSSDVATLAKSYAALGVRGFG